MSLEKLRSMRPYTAAMRIYRPPRFKKPGVAKDFVPVLATGGIGDLIISLGVCTRICEKVGPVRLWSRYPEVAKFFLDQAARAGSTWGITIEEGPLEGFDHWLQLNSLAKFQFENNFKGFHLAKTRGMFLHWSGYSGMQDWSNAIAFHPGMDYEVSRLGIERGWTRETLPYQLLGLGEPWRTPVAHRVPAGPYDWEPFITVHDGFDTTQPGVHRATKTWSIRHWAEFVERFKAKYPIVMVVQLGGPTSRQIPGVDINLVGKTSITESLRILSRSLLHVDGDSGLVHAAHALGRTSIVLFGPTPAKFFGYPGNYNIAPSYCGGCWWLKESWLAACPLEYSVPKCMDSITPDQVLSAAEEHLARRP